MIAPMKVLQNIEEARGSFRAIRRPSWIYASAALTLDGKITSERKPLGGKVDKEWYRFLVAESEVVVVGAQTFRGSSAYKGKDVVILSQSLRFPKGSFESGSYTIYTESSDRPNLGPYVRIKPLVSAENILRGLGARKILVDGGGSAYTMFGELIEDWFLTLVPRFSGDSQVSLWTGDESPELRPSWMLEADGRMLCRFQRRF